MRCEVTELNSVPAEWTDMFTGPENILTVRTIDLLMETDQHGLVESIRFCRIANVMAIEVNTHHGRGGNVYVYNRSRLVDPLVWNIEDPGAFIDELCDDIRRCNEVLAGAGFDAFDAELSGEERDER